MIRLRQFILPMFLLALALWLSWRYPSWALLWTLLFFVGTALFLLAAMFFNFMRLDLLYRQSQFNKLIAICSGIVGSTKSSALKNIANVYLGGALAASGDQELRDRAKNVLATVDVKTLSPRFHNRWQLFNAQLAVYDHNPEQAFSILQSATADSLGIFYLSRMFYIFSLVFVQLNRDLERAKLYAEKAVALEPSNSLFKAQLGLSLIKSGDVERGNQLLAEALPELPTHATWEKQFYQTYVQTNPAAPLH